MKFVNGKQNCAWCHWRYSRNGHKHECEALARPMVALRGCHCGHCDYRKYNRCPLASGMKEKTEWCDCGLTFEPGECPDVCLDNVCALFTQIDFKSHNPLGWHPVDVEKAYDKEMELMNSQNKKGKR